MSLDPAIREIAHFEGHLTPEAYHNMITPQISEEDIKYMKDIGYRIMEFGRFNWDIFIEVLTTYKKLYGHVNVPKDFVVTEDMVYWNERREDGEEDVQSEVIRFQLHHEGFLLGEAVEGVRIGDFDGLEDPVRRPQLDALGFDWGDKSLHCRFRFPPMLLGLQIYRHLYSFPMPQTSFVVPDERQWPYWMAGMPLGEWVTVMRVQQKMFAEHYPQRKWMIDAMEFLWWIMPASSLDEKYYSPVE